MKAQWSKLFVVTVVFLLLAGACAAPPPPPTPAPPTATPVPPTPTPDPAAPVKAWVDALNSGDVDAALAPFTDDVKFSVFEYYASNKDGLRGIFDWLAGLETKYQIKECQTKEDRVVCTMPVSDACIAGYDPVDGLMTTMTFVLTQDGKIAQANGRLDGFNDYYAKWISPGTTWMRANRAEALAKAESTSDGREAGAIQAKLCKEYGESLKATPAAKSDLTAPVQAWVDAMNSGDVDAALALFADDGKYQIHYNASGKEQIRPVFDWLAGLETESQLTDCQLKSDRVVCNYTVRDGCMAAFGTDGLPVKATFVFQDGKIKQAIGSGTGGEWDSYWKFVDAEMAWAAVNRAEEWAKFRPLSKEFAPVAVRLCKEYAESLKATPAATAPVKAGENQVLLIAQEQSEDMEFMLTKEVGVMIDMLEKAGYKVVVASASGQPITGGATTLKPDLKLADVKVDDYVGFMFPCMAVDMDLPPPPEAVRIAKEAVAQGKPVAAQVGGVVTLASAEVLNGKQFAFPEDPGAYMPGSIYKGTGVVQDGNIITSGTCPYMAKMMGRTDGTPELTQKLIDSLAASQ